MKIYIDSNVFINAKKRKEKRHKISKEFMKYVTKLNEKNNKIEFYTSRFTGVELASAMIRTTKNSYRAKSILFDLENEWKDKIELVPNDPEEEISWGDLVSDLIQIALGYKVPATDCIHAKFLLKYKFDYFITWNKKHFKLLIRKIKNTKMLDPKEFLDILDKLKKKSKQKDKTKKRYIDRELLLTTLRNYISHKY